MAGPVVVLGLLGVALTACGGSSSSSSSTTTTTTVATTSTSSAALAGNNSLACAQALQSAQSLGPRISSAVASNNAQAARQDEQRALSQFQAAANEPGTPPAVKTALNKLVS